MLYGREHEACGEQRHLCAWLAQDGPEGQSAARLCVAIASGKGKTEKKEKKKRKEKKRIGRDVYLCQYPWFYSVWILLLFHNWLVGV